MTRKIIGSNVKLTRPIVLPTRNECIGKPRFAVVYVNFRGMLTYVNSYPKLEEARLCFARAWKNANTARVHKRHRIKCVELINLVSDEATFSKEVAYDRK